MLRNVVASFQLGRKGPAYTHWGYSLLMNEQIQDSSLFAICSKNLYWKKDVKQTKATADEKNGVCHLG